MLFINTCMDTLLAGVNELVLINHKVWKQGLALFVCLAAIDLSFCFLYAHQTGTYNKVP